MSVTFDTGLASIAAARTDRLLAAALAPIHRGPCGGWHYTDTRNRRRACRACLALANPLHRHLDTKATP